MSKVVLLDRDGTVIVDPPDLRVDSFDKIALFDDSISSLTYLADNGFSVIFVTNQAGIEEGRITEEQFWQIHNEVLRPLSDSGVKVLRTYMNGDNQSDIDAAERAGCKGGILVKTANENVESPNAVFTAPRLTDAVKYVVLNTFS